MNTSTQGAHSELALYIHWPWCLKKCPYCDFNIRLAATMDEKTYISCLIKHLKYIKIDVSNYILTSIFIGGGTPSLASGDSIKHLLSTIHELYQVAPDCEITMECNPYPMPDFLSYTEAGVNRFSLGIQSLHDTHLQFLGREHNSAQARVAIDKVFTFCNNVNLDFIYGIPSQTLTEWEKDLFELQKRAPMHISAYQLTIEPNSKFFSDVKRNHWTMPNEHDLHSFFEITRERLIESGYLHYEISNFAKSPNAICRYNQHVWDYKPYLGIGAGAHGRYPLARQQPHTAMLPRAATVCWNKPESYIEKIAAQHTGFSTFNPLTMEAQQEEALLMGLRTSKGVCSELLSKPLQNALQAECKIADLAILFNHGFLALQHNRLIATPKGWPVLDSLTEQLLTIDTALSR